ncbi:MAG: virulence factor [Legionella sp.]|nr:virulence factor [Legionella sp.]
MSDASDNNQDVFDKYLVSSAENLSLSEQVYQISWNLCADIRVAIISPEIPPFAVPVIIPPALVTDSGEEEFVYPIVDYGNEFATTKGFDMPATSMSNCKLFYTIEKMMRLVIERLEEQGVDGETEVQITVDGHEIACRKAFEVVINCTKNNLVIINYDPGAWGDNYLQMVKKLAAEGYGYPPEAPRETQRVRSKSISPVRGR